MTSWKEFWDSKRSNADQKKFKAEPVKPISGSCWTASDCAQGYACVDGECYRAPNQTGSEQCPVDDGRDNCSGCGGSDPGCKNGIVTIDNDGNKICVPKACDNTSPCPSGYGCKNGQCTQANCSGSRPCAAGYICCNGFCTTECDGTCRGNYQCPYGSACVDGQCEEVPVEEPNFPIDDKQCDDFCNNFSAENGTTANGCQGKTCGNCQRCWNGFCEPDNRTCECQKANGQLPECKTCENGEVVDSCSCNSCSTVYGNPDCGCGIVLNGPITKCKGVCEGGPSSSTLLNQEITRRCEEACNSGDSPQKQCEGDCATIVTSNDNYDCPTGYNCKIVGTIAAGGNVEYIYKNCNTQNLPDFCKDNPNLNNAHLAFSVIDEDDSYSASQRNSDWQRFRSVHPDSPFVVLVPQLGNGTVTSPAGYDGGRKNVSGSSDWASAMAGQLAVVSSAFAFIDSSGSMTVADVQVSLTNFTAYCAANGIDFNWTTNGSENWIGPHI